MCIRDSLGAGNVFRVDVATYHRLCANRQASTDLRIPALVVRLAAAGGIGDVDVTGTVGLVRTRTRVADKLATFAPASSDMRSGFVRGSVDQRALYEPHGREVDVGGDPPDFTGQGSFAGRTNRGQHVVDCQGETETSVRLGYVGAESHCRQAWAGCRADGRLVDFIARLIRPCRADQFLLVVVLACVAKPAGQACRFIGRCDDRPAARHRDPILQFRFQWFSKPRSEFDAWESRDTVDTSAPPVAYAPANKCDVAFTKACRQASGVCLMIDVSIIIVSYNTRKLLADCLATISAGVQGFSAETLVVDNASSDGSGDMVARDFDWVRLIHNNRNAGFAAANNMAIREAKGRYILLLNSDTRLYPGAVAQMIRFMDEHPRVGYCGPCLLNPDGSHQPSARRFPTVLSAGFSTLGLTHRFPSCRHTSDLHGLHGDRRHFRADWLSGACLMVRRSVLSQVGLLDEGFFMYFEETDWCRSMAQRGWEGWYVPTAKVVHLGAVSYTHLTLPTN